MGYVLRTRMISIKLLILLTIRLSSSTEDHHKLMLENKPAHLLEGNTDVTRNVPTLSPPSYDYVKASNMETVLGRVKSINIDAKKGFDVIAETIFLLEGKTDFLTAMTAIAKLTESFALPFAAISSVLSVINAFLPKPDSAEMVAIRKGFKEMHERFDKVESKLDELTGQLANVLKILKDQSIDIKVSPKEETFTKFISNLNTILEIYNISLEFKELTHLTDAFYKRCDSESVLNGLQLWNDFKSYIISSAMTKTLTELYTTYFDLPLLDAWSKYATATAIKVKFITHACEGTRPNNEAYMTWLNQKTKSDLNDITDTLKGYRDLYDKGWKNKIKGEMKSWQRKLFCGAELRKDWAQSYLEHLQNRTNLTWMVAGVPFANGMRFDDKGKKLVDDAKDYIHIQQNCLEENNCFEAELDCGTIYIAWVNNSIMFSKIVINEVINNQTDKCEDENNNLTKEELIPSCALETEKPRHCIRHMFGNMPYTLCPRICNWYTYGGLRTQPRDASRVYGNHGYCSSGIYYTNWKYYRPDIFNKAMKNGFGNELGKNTKFLIFLQQTLLDGDGENPRQMSIGVAYNTPSMSPFFKHNICRYRLKWLNVVVAASENDADEIYNKVHTGHIGSIWWWNWCHETGFHQKCEFKIYDLQFTTIGIIS